MKEKIQALKKKLLDAGYCLAGDDESFTAMNFDTCSAYSFKVMPDDTMDVQPLKMEEV